MQVVVGAGARTVLATKLAAAAAAATAAVVVVLDQSGLLDVPSTGRAVAGVTAAALAFGSTTASAAREYRAPALAARRDDVRLLLQGLALTVYDLTRIDVRDLGLAVYVVRRDRWPPWRTRLQRVHRERAIRRPSASHVAWRPGKGVIGRCVQSGADEAQDVGADTAPWAHVDRETFEQRVPEAVRAGLTYEEFRSLLGRYHVVVATPVLDDRHPTTKVLGCLAIDGPPGSYDDLAADDVRAAMAEAAVAVRPLLV